MPPNANLECGGSPSKSRQPHNSRRAVAGVGHRPPGTGRAGRPESPRPAPACRPRARRRQPRLQTIAETGWRTAPRRCQRQEREALSLRDAAVPHRATLRAHFLRARAPLGNPSRQRRSRSSPRGHCKPAPNSYPAYSQPSSRSISMSPARTRSPSMHRPTTIVWSPVSWNFSASQAIHPRAVSSTGQPLS